MPMILHKPWIVCNLPILLGIYNNVCVVIQKKIDAGVFEPSNSSYRSCWFCVVKKDGTLLRMVQLLELLNMVTIVHSGVLPFTEQLVEQFAGRACGTMLDLFFEYDEPLKLSQKTPEFVTLFGNTFKDSITSFST